AHEDLGGVAVEPEEAEAGAEHGGGDDGHFLAVVDVGDEQLLGDEQLAGDEGEEEEGEADDGHDAAGEAVEPVGEIHGVAGAGEYDRAEEDEPSLVHRDFEVLEKGEVEGVGVLDVLAVLEGEVGEDNAEADLEEELFEARSEERRV